MSVMLLVQNTHKTLLSTCITVLTYWYNADNSNEEASSTYTPCHDPPAPSFVDFQSDSHQYCVKYCYLDK